MGLFSWRETKKKNKDGEMSFLDHLEALRWHIIRSIVAVLIFSIFLFSYRVEIIGGVFMSPFDKNFVTYRVLCNYFGQLCNNNIRIQEVELESPDSLTLEGYMWLPTDEGEGNNVQDNPPEPGDFVPDNGESDLNDTCQRLNVLDPGLNENQPLQDGGDEVEATAAQVNLDSLDSSQNYPSTDGTDSILIPLYDTEQTNISAPIADPFLTNPNLNGPKTQRQPVRIQFSVEQFLSNGKFNGLSVQTQKGSFVKFQATSPYEQFMKALLYAFFGGLICAFPYVIWEIWRFVQPALNRKERGLVRWNVFYSSLLFFMGVLFGYFIILPFSITFLSSFILFDEAENIWRIGDVVNFILVLLFGSGFLFQLPVGIYYASKIGFVTPKWLRKYRKHAVVVLLAIAAIITPPDPASQILIFLPLIGLYEIGIGISARVLRKNQKREADRKVKDDEWRRGKEEEYKQRLKEQEKIEPGAAVQPAGQEEVNFGTVEDDKKGYSDEEEKDTDGKNSEDDDFDLRPPEGAIGRDN